MVKSGTLYAIWRIGWFTSVAHWIGALNASGSICILEIVSSTHVLTKLSADIEVDIGRWAEPSWYVKYWSLAVRKTACVCQSPRSQYFNSKYTTVNREFPLILKSTSCINCFESCDSHDKIINKLWRKRPPSSIHIVIPLIVHNLVSIRILYI